MGKKMALRLLLCSIVVEVTIKTDQDFTYFLHQAKTVGLT